MKVFSLETFEEMLATPDMPKPKPGETPGLRFSSQCCANAPMYGVYMKDSGKVTLICVNCGQATAQILVARSLIVLPRGNGKVG